MPGDFGSKSRKNRKIRKVEKSKNSNNSKNSKKSKSRKLFGFLTFCEHFPWKSDKPRGFIHAQGFLWLFGCSFPVEWLVTFQGSRKLAISVSGLDFVLLMQFVGFSILLFFCVGFVGFESWILKTHKIAEQVFGSGPPGPLLSLTVLSCNQFRGQCNSSCNILLPV